MSVVVRTARSPAPDEETPLLVTVHDDDDYAAPAHAFPPSRTQTATLLRRRRRTCLRTSAKLLAMFFWRLGALYGATAVAFGAFGAHGLKDRIKDPAKLASWSTAAHYQLVHSVAVLAARGHPAAALCFTAGMTLFSGSIYALVLDPERFKVLGPATPVGGLFLIAGWLVLAFSRGGIRL